MLHRRLIVLSVSGGLLGTSLEKAIVFGIVFGWGVQPSSLSRPGTPFDHNIAGVEAYQSGTFMWLVAVEYAGQ